MYFSVFIILTLIAFSKSELELVTDDKFLTLIQKDKHVIVLFSKRDCEACTNYENELTSIREDLVDHLHTWVVKVVDSYLTKSYTPSKEPAIVFFRYGVPLLYDGPLNGEFILDTFINNKEPIVKELTDETFEHLTQASSGATTGDWFIMFYTNDCIDCKRMQARWEAVGAHLKSRMNVARVNRATTGAATARRFGVFHVPAFLLLRQGKVYKYEIHKYDVTSFVSFAQDWYKNVSPENVPHPKTPFDDLVAKITDYLKENPWLFQVGFVTFILGLGISVIMKFKNSRKQTSEKPKNK